MQEQQRQILEQKKKALKCRQEAQELVRKYIEGWLPLLDYLTAQHVPYRLEYLCCAPQEHYPYLLAALEKHPLAGYPLQPAQIKESGTWYIHSKTERLYPSVHPLRYVPEGNGRLRSEHDAARALELAAASLSLDDEEVYFYYCRYAPVVQLRFSDLRRHAGALYMPHALAEDVCVVAPDFRWLIFRSLEEEWRWGKLHPAHAV